MGEVLPPLPISRNARFPVSSSQDQAASNWIQGQGGSACHRPGGVASREPQHRAPEHPAPWVCARQEEPPFPPWGRSRGPGLSRPPRGSLFSLSQLVWGF